MKQPIKKGQNPTKPNISEKDDYSLLFEQPTILDLPDNCKSEVESKGLEGRWIDLVLLQKNGGMHRKGWQPYKFDCLGKTSSSNPFGGQSGQYEGYLIRQQLIYATKTKEEAELERRKINLRIKLQADPAALKVKEMREYVKNSGVKGMVVADDEDEEF